MNCEENETVFWVWFLVFERKMEPYTYTILDIRCFAEQKISIVTISFKIWD